MSRKIYFWNGITVSIVLFKLPPKICLNNLRITILKYIINTEFKGINANELVRMMLVWLLKRGFVLEG